MSNTTEVPASTTPKVVTTPTATNPTSATSTPATEHAETETPASATPTSNTASGTTTASGNWNEQKGKLKAKFSTLTDADLHYENGKKDEMFAKIQVKIGKTKEELHTIIAAL